PTKAANLYRQVLDTQPDSVIALNNLAVLNADDHPQQALAYAKKAHDRAPDSAAVTDTLGWLLVGQNQLDAGIELLEKAENDAGKASPEIRYHLGAALAKRGHGDDVGRATSLLQQALASGLPEDEAGQARVVLKKLGADNGASGDTG
ncbi:MAG TPA: hypothetical protein VFJ08_06845, partial [Salinisphaera sp.]